VVPPRSRQIPARGTIVVFGAASGPADPIPPNVLISRSLTVGGGSQENYIRTREELLRRSREVLEGIQAGWLKLRIDRVLPLAEAAGYPPTPARVRPTTSGHGRVPDRLLEGRQSTGKLLLRTGQ
jgi:NADPH:quinone reductase